MSGKIVTQILEQVNQHPQAKHIKKLLLLRLEQDVSESRGLFDGVREPYVAVETEIRNYGDPIPAEEPVAPIVPEPEKHDEVKPEEEELKDAAV